eukprot:1572300-Pleurochrysis_carterae.AAC.1
MHPFAHQRRSVLWMAAVESATAAQATVDVHPLTFAEREFGHAYKVVLPSGGVIAHPPGEDRTLRLSLFHRPL